MDPAETLRVEVVYSAGPGQTDGVHVALPPGSRLQDALAASGLLERHGLAVEAMPTGIWGKLRAADTPLRDRDRVEIYRPLLVDPKEARRQRYRKHKPARSSSGSRS